MYAQQLVRLVHNRERQIDDERGAFADAIARGADLAAVHLDELFHERGSCTVRAAFRRRAGPSGTVQAPTNCG